jgi:hypothetical protein
MEEQDNESFNEVFNALIKNILPSRLITNFIIIAEVADNDTSELSVSVSDGLAPWAADGMLRYAQQMVMTGDFNSQSESDDED